MTISARQQRRMQLGRERRLKEQIRIARERVDTYVRWVKDGSDFHTIPYVPTDAEFKLARRREGAGG